MPSYFARNLEFLRKQQDLSTSEISAKLQLAENQWLNFEQGKVEPDFELLIRISDFFHQSMDRLIRIDQQLRFHQWDKKQIKLILLDVDGTMTDGGMYYSESGDQAKRFHSQDGLAIHRLITRYGMEFGFISSGSTTAIVRKRAKKTGSNKDLLWNTTQIGSS